jgi:mRNA interferase MazF
MQDPAAQAMGLLSDSVIVTDHLATIEEREIDKKIGHCPLMSKVDDALKITLGLC